jgi:hypothetical protein
MYYGAAAAAAPWFAAVGVPVPFGVNVSDHMLDLANGDLPGRTATESRTVQRDLIAAFSARAAGARMGLAVRCTCVCRRALHAAGVTN